jgi:acetoacetyl-CoA synthetase
LPAMGFVPLDRVKRFSPPLNYARRSRNRRVSVTVHPTHLRADLQRILDDHAPYQCLPVLLIDEEEVLIIVHRWLFRRLLPFSEILYCNAPDVLKRHLDMVKSVIMREQKTLGLVFGEHLQCGDIYLSKKTLFRSSHFAAHDLDKLYSELTLLL